jgi:glycerate kinase
MTMPYRIVLAFDSFKGSLSAVEACLAAAAGAERAGAECESCPLSDGGEGFVESLVLAANGSVVETEVTGPLFERVVARVGLIDEDRTAVIEAAQACGLGLVPEHLRNPMLTTSTGVGEMLALAASLDVDRVVVGVGGTATNDCGMGMLSALGWRFTDRDGRSLAAVGASLGEVARFEPGSPLGVEVVVACDVQNPLYGPEGAAFVYAPQKGASPADVERLDAGLRHFAATTHPEFAQVAGAGAAGGLGYALTAFLGGKIESGAEMALDLAGFQAKLERADLCLTGEGRTDGQTAFGKLPAAVASACKSLDKPCVCVSGAVGPGWEALLELGCAEVVSLSNGPDDAGRSITEAAARLKDTAERLVGVYRAGGRCDEDCRT